MKQLSKTKVTVRLRKAEDRKEWYVYLESYPVEVTGKKKPQRIREYLNKMVSTVEWDKNRIARTNADGKKSFKPKRNDNGIIICRSENDKETMLYADELRKFRQKEYDQLNLYSDTEEVLTEQKEKSQENFIKYFEKEGLNRHKNSSKSIQINWERALDYLKQHAGDTLRFSQIDKTFGEDYKRFLLNIEIGEKDEKRTLSNNTASTYFALFKAALKQAFIDGYLSVDMASRIKGIPRQETRREYLTIEELEQLAITPCSRDVLKNAALFSALTGLRHSDIQKLYWGEISEEDGIIKLNFTQKKTKGVEYMPISEQALQLCGERRLPEQLVFEDLPDPSWISRPLKKWVKAAGITKSITFHSFRHTFATLQLSSGTDIYTVSKMLGHTNVKTTQVYAKVVDEKKNKAAEAIQLKSLKLPQNETKTL